MKPVKIEFSSNTCKADIGMPPGRDAVLKIKKASKNTNDHTW